jgi:hypothetical protein
MLRVSVNSFFDMTALATKTLDAFWLWNQILNACAPSRLLERVTKISPPYHTDSMHDIRECTCKLRRAMYVYTNTCIGVEILSNNAM